MKFAALIMVKTSIGVGTPLPFQARFRRCCIIPAYAADDFVIEKGTWQRTLPSCRQIMCVELGQVACTALCYYCRYLSELEMKLYLAAEDVDIALEDDSSRALQRIPASEQDVVHLEVRSVIVIFRGMQWL